jgi:ketosteroid isomerase-like protein
MDINAETQKIHHVIQAYPEALANCDVTAWEDLFWLEDPSFTEIENDKPTFLNKQYIEMISDFLRKNTPGPPNQKWYDTKVFLLTPDIAYSISLRDEINTHQTSRVTLIFKKKGDEWRIIHGHFSNVPK